MEHAKKMVVVPQELISRLDTSAPQPQSYSGGLDAEMQRILNDKSSTLDISDKWKQYQQVLQRYLHVAAERRQPIHLPVMETDANLLVDEIVDSLPSVYRNESRALLRALHRKGADHITWDNNGTVYVNGGQKINDSNIVDIVHSIVRARRTQRLPPGWTEVMTVLKDMNVPSTYIGNPTSLEFLGRKPYTSPLAAGIHTPVRPSSSSTPLSLFPTPDSTPQRRRGVSQPSKLTTLWEKF